MPITLYDHDGHRCLMFTDLCDERGEAVQSNQFLIVDDGTGAVIDPGGNLAYSELYLAMTRHFPPSALTALIASHADPDIIASARPLDHRHAGQHLHQHGVGALRAPLLQAGQDHRAHRRHPRPGMRIRVGRNDLIALPAHFLHAEGNFQFYDPVSAHPVLGRPGRVAGQRQAGGTSRAPAWRRCCRDGSLPPPLHGQQQGAAAVGRHGEPLPIEMIVPQHGAPLGPGGGRVHRLGARLQCGIDLFQAAHLDGGRVVRGAHRRHRAARQLRGQRRQVRAPAAPAMSEEAIAHRIQPVGMVALKDASAVVELRTGEQVYTAAMR
jgi:hypothetical protein